MLQTGLHLAILMVGAVALVSANLSALAGTPKCPPPYDPIPCSWLGGDPNDKRICCSSFCLTVQNSCFNGCVAQLPGDSYLNQLLKGLCNTECVVVENECERYALSWRMFNLQENSVNDLTAWTGGSAENAEHITYVGITPYIGTEPRIFELFFFIGRDREWRAGVPGAVSDVHVLPETSPTSWYTTPENVEHIAYVGADHSIHELFFFIGRDREWRAGVPGAVSDVPVLPGTSPTSWYNTPENVEHIAYVGTDQSIHELFFFIGGDGVWHHTVPGGASDVPVAPGTSPTSWYTTPENVEHIAYVGADQRIHELFFLVGPNGKWLQGFPGGAIVDTVNPGSSPASWNTKSGATGRSLDGYWVGSDNSQHVNYIDLNGYVHELYIHPGASWVDNNLTAWTSRPPAAVGSALNGYWVGSDNSQHVNYIDSRGHVHELYIHPGAFWVDNDLIAWTNGTPAAIGSALHGYWLSSDNSQHVNYIDDGGHVHELYIHPGAFWADNDLRFFADWAAKKWPLRGSLKGPAGDL
jgi:hypothetical protein